MSEQLFIMEGEGVVNIYNGNYSEYRLSLDLPKEKTPVAAVKAKETVPATNKLSHKEQKELDDAEALIAQSEAEIEKLTSSLLSIDSANYQEIQAVTKSIESINNTLEQTMERWLDLSEKKNKTS
jgi:ATP-binding cassette subfamily F protein uup